MSQLPENRKKEGYILNSHLGTGLELLVTTIRKKTQLYEGNKDRPAELTPGLKLKGWTEKTDEKGVKYYNNGIESLWQLPLPNTPGSFVVKNHVGEDLEPGKVPNDTLLRISDISRSLLSGGTADCKPFESVPVNTTDIATYLENSGPKCQDFYLCDGKIWIDEIFLPFGFSFDDGGNRKPGFFYINCIDKRDPEKGVGKITEKIRSISEEIRVLRVLMHIKSILKGQPGGERIGEMSISDILREIIIIDPKTSDISVNSKSPVYELLQQNKRLLGFTEITHKLIDSTKITLAGAIIGALIGTISLAPIAAPLATALGVAGLAISVPGTASAGIRITEKQIFKEKLLKLIGRLKLLEENYGTELKEIFPPLSPPASRLKSPREEVEAAGDVGVGEGANTMRPVSFGYTPELTRAASKPRAMRLGSGQWDEATVSIEVGGGSKKNKYKRNKTRRNKTRRNKTRRNKTRRNKTYRNKTRRNKTRRNKK